jgi:hypothetical protein
MIWQCVLLGNKNALTILSLWAPVFAVSSLFWAQLWYKKRRRHWQWCITFFYLYLCIHRYTWWISTFGTHFYRLLLVVLWVLEIVSGRYILWSPGLVHVSKCYQLCIHYLWCANWIIILAFATMMQIRSIEMLHKRFESFPEAFSKNLSPQRFLALISECLWLITYELYIFLFLFIISCCGLKLLVFILLLSYAAGYGADQLLRYTNTSQMLVLILTLKDI